MTRRDEVLEELCKLARQVMEAHDCKHAADCFCGLSDAPNPFYSFDPFVLKFIQDAVREKLEREKKKE